MLGEAFYSLLHDVHKLKCTDIDLNEDRFGIVTGKQIGRAHV